MDHNVLTKTPLLTGNTDAPRSVHGRKEKGKRALTLERHIVLVDPRMTVVLLKESYLNDLTCKLHRLEKKATVSSEFTQQSPLISCRCPLRFLPAKTFPMLFRGKAWHSCTGSEEDFELNEKPVAGWTATASLGKGRKRREAARTEIKVRGDANLRPVGEPRKHFHFPTSCHYDKLKLFPSAPPRQQKPLPPSAQGASHDPPWCGKGGGGAPASTWAPRSCS